MYKTKLSEGYKDFLKDIKLGAVDACSEENGDKYYERENYHFIESSWGEDGRINEILNSSDVKVVYEFCNISKWFWQHVKVDSMSIEARYQNRPFTTIYTPAQQALDGLRKRINVI